jgi:FkbM family methyltransferase
MYPEASIVAIEPNQKTFDLLRKNTLDLKNVSLLNAAVSIIEGESDLFISTSKWTWGDSIKSIWQEGLPSIKVKTILLSNLIRQPIDLLKLDIEGAECEVLYEVKNKLHLVKEMIMEFHISPTCPENSFEKTYKLLIDSGFKIRVTKWFRFGIEIKNFSKLPKKTQLVIHAKR